MLESTAYTRLRDKGLCDRGIVPRFLGSMRKFDQSLCQPYLEMFLDDEYPPSAIFLEYIPNMEMITLNNYTQQRMDNLIAGIREIHKTLVLHGDLKPRNMMVVKDDPERVIWIDFDRAVTYEEASITDSEKSLLEDEEITLVYFKQFMVSSPVIGIYGSSFLIISRKTIWRKGNSKMRISFIALDGFVSLGVMYYEP